MKTYQLARKLKNVWLDSVQAAEIFGMPADSIDDIITHKGAPKVRYRLNDKRDDFEYCLYDVCRELGKNELRLINQTLWLLLALCVLLCTAVPLAAAFLTQ